VSPVASSVSSRSVAVLRGWGASGRGAARVDRTVRDERGGRRPWQEFQEAIDGDADLPVLRHEVADHAGDLREPADVGDEEREVAHGEAPVAHRPRGHQQHRAGPQVGRVVGHRLQELREHEVVEHGLAARLVDRAQVAHHAPLGPGDLDRADRAEDLSQQPRDVADSLLVGLTVPLDALARQVDDREHDHQREENGQRERAVDAQQHHEGHEGHRGLPDRVERPGQEVHHVLHIVAEAADRLAWRGGDRPRAGPSQDVREQVLAQQRGRQEVHRRLGHHCAEQGGDAQRGHGDKQGDEAPGVEASPRPVAQTVEEPLHHQPRHEREDVEHHAGQQPAGREEPRAEARQPPEVAIIARCARSARGPRSPRACSIAHARASRSPLRSR